MSGLFIQMLFEDPMFYLFTVLIVMFSICLHEYAHAYTAWKLGDDTSMLLGHLSLNPLKQMGPISIGILLLIGIAWGAVPVNERNFRNRTRDSATVAAAGPAANLFLCALFGLIWTMTDMTLLDVRQGDPLAVFLSQAAIMNGTLFVFNIVPCPPLDGFTIAKLFVPALRRLHPHMVSQISTYFLLIVFASGIGRYFWTGGETVASWFMATP